MVRCLLAFGLVIFVNFLHLAKGVGVDDRTGNFMPLDGEFVITEPVSGSPFCAGQQVMVPFTVIGTILSGNVFTAELSDAFGSFASPTVIGSLTGTTSDTIVATLPSGLGDGTGYRIRVNSSNPSSIGSANVNDLTIHSIPATPTITPDGPTQFCPGGSVTLTSSSSTNNTWSPNGETTESIVVSAAGNYSVVVDNFGCPSEPSNEITVVISPTPPVPTITPSGPTTFCNGDSVTLTSSALFGNMWSSGQTTRSIVVKVSGSYTVTRANIFGCTSTSAPTVVTVITVPTPTVSPAGPVALCTGDSVTLTSSSPTGNTWSTGVTTQSITVSTAGDYWVIADDGTCFSDTSAVVSVSVNSIPPDPTITPSGPTQFCPGGSVTLTSSSPTNNVWSTGETTESIVVSTAGSYWVYVDNNGCASDTSEPVTVVISPTPPVPTITPSGPTTFCNGDSVTLTSSALFGNMWSTGQTTRSIVVKVSGSYTVTRANIFGCTSTSAPAVVTVITVPTPTVSPAGPVALCTGDSVTLTSSSPTGNTWSTGATTQSITVSTAGDYWVIADDGTCFSDTSAVVSVSVNSIPPDPTITPSGPTQFCPGGSVTLTSSSPTNNVWSTGETTESIVVSTAGSYWVYVDNNGCASDTSSPITVTLSPTPPIPTITPSGPTTFCNGDSVTLTSSALFGNMWSSGQTTRSIVVKVSGSYTVTRANIFGCTSTSAPTVVTVITVPTPTVNPAGPVALCTGDSVTLTSSSPTGNTWSTGATTQSITVSTAGDYWVIADDGTCFSDTSAVVSVTVNPIPPDPTITPSGPTQFCPGGSVTLTSSSPTNNVWSTGETTASIVVTTAGNYWVYVDNNGCASDTSSSITVTLSPTPPVPTITPSGPTTFCNGDSVTLTSSALFGNTWSTGQTTQSIVVKVSGSYTVTRANIFGCTSTSAPTVVTVTIVPTPTISPASPVAICTGDSVTLTSSSNSGNTWSTSATTQSITVNTAGDYWVLADDGTCFSDTSAVVEVILNPLPPTPTITPSGPTTFCDGDSVTLTSSAPSNNLWSTGATTQSITVSTAGSYTVTASNAFGCTATSGSTIITVNPTPATPTINANGPLEFCSGQGVTLTSSSSTNNVWSSGHTAPFIVAGASGTYWVLVDDGTCVSDTSLPVTVTVYPTPPTPTITPGGSVTLCPTDSLTLTSNIPTGNIWSTGDTTQSIVVDAAGDYWVYINTGHCVSDTSAPVTVIISSNYPTPVISPAGPIQICSGQSMVLTSSAPDHNFWSNGETTPTITVSTAGDYWVYTDNGICVSDTSDIVSVTISPSPPTPNVTANGPTTFCTGGSVILSTGAPFGNQWSTGETTQSITVTTSGTYTVTRTNIFGCSRTSAPMVVTVLPYPQTPVITPSGSTQICPGDSVTLTSDISQFNSWSTGATTQSITVGTPGTYYVIGDNGYCTSDTSNFVTVGFNPEPPVPTITPNGPTTFCPSDNVILTSSAPSGNLWSTGETTVSITVTAAGSYTVTETNGFGCSATSAPTVISLHPFSPAPTINPAGSIEICEGESVTLASSSPTDNFWSTGETTNMITVDTAGTFWVYVDDGINCPSDTSTLASVSVTPLPPTPVITPDGPTTFCSTDSVILTSSSPTDNYWSTGENTQSITVTTAGDYWVFVEGVDCYSDTSAIVTVTITTVAPTPTITPDGPTTFCSTDSVTLTSSSPNSNFWSTGATTQSIVVNTSGTYWVYVDNGSCISDTSAPVTVTVNPNPPTPTITPSGPTQFCPGSSVTLTSSSPTGNIWSTGETTSSIVVSTAGDYWVYVDDGNCVSDTSALITITISPTPPVPTIIPGGPTTFCPGDSVILTSSAPFGNVWSTGATTQSITVYVSGSYTVSRFNMFGCSSTSAPVVVTVVDTINPTISCPADVTMNNDGGACGAVVNYTVNANDNCPNFSLAQTGGLPSGSLFPVGTTTNSFTVTDFSGHTATCSFDVTVNDNEDPTITCPANFTMGNTLGMCGAMVPYTVNFNDNCPGSTLVQNSGIASGSFFPLGTTSNTFTVTDAAGFTATCSFDVTVNDTEAPEIECNQNATVPTDPGLCITLLLYQAPVGTDNCPGATTVQLAGPPSGSTVTVGVYTETFMVTDAAGNTTSCSWIITVVDNEDPTIICPADTTMGNTVGLCGAILNYTVNANDNCTGFSTVQNSGLASGSTFPIGTTTNSFTVTDAGGRTATCSFDVTVNDTENPTVTCPANDTLSNDNGLCGATVNYTVNFSDNCPGATLVQNAGLASGSLFPVGTTSNSFTVTDAIGNTATCSFAVTVNDTETPVVTCQDIQVSPTTIAPAVVTPAQVTLTATDNCGIASSTVTPDTFTCAQAGQIIVADLAVTDIHGNVGHCTVNVEVLGTGCNQAPIAVCQNVTVNADSNCQGNAPATAFDGGSTDPNGDSLIFSVSPAGPYALGTTNVVLTVSDGSLSSTCSATITVLDVTPPVVTCPANINVNTGVGCSAVVNYTVNFSDNCPGSSLAQTAGFASGSSFPVGTTTNSFTVTDGSGNTATCSFDITVSDNEIPIIKCPSTVVIPNDSGVCGALVNYVVTTSDNCPGFTLTQTAGLPSGSIFPIGTTSNSFVLTDASGNSDSCSFDVTVNDVENPTITCPANITVSNDNGTCGAVVSYSVSFGDNCPGSTLAQTAGLASGSVFPVGTTTNSFTATDASGNTATCSFDVIVNDTENPTITCPANITVSNDNGSCGAVVTYTVNFGDNCPGSTLAQNTGLASGSIFPVGTTSNSFTVTDASGNTATCSFTVTVNDTENPTINCPANITVSNDNGSCGAVVGYTVNFSDNCPGSTLAQNTGLASGSTFPVGTTSNSFTVTDASGNTATCGFTVTVNDTENPTITCPANITVGNDNGSCGAVVSYTVNFNDNCPGSTLAQNTGLASGSTFPVGTTSNSFTVTDASGNTATCGFTVTVNDTENPTITCPANITVGNDNGSCGAVVSYTVNFSDNCPGSTLAQNTGLASGSTFPVGTTSNSFTVTDASGNTATCGFTVTVNDTENPTITCPANITVSNDNGSCGAVVTYTVNFGDNCPGSTLAQNTGLASGSIFPVGTTSNSFTVTDASGNTATCSFTVTVNDTENPTINCPANITVSNDNGSCGAVVGYTVNFSDNCPGSTLAQNTGLASGSTFPVGTTSNSFTVTDASGNTATCGFTVTVNDTENPTITCPANITVGNDSGTCGAVVTYAVNFSDNCPGSTLAQNTGLASGSTFPVGTTSNSFTVTDASGNTATCGFTVTVNDTENPTITCPANITVGNDNGSCGAVVGYTVSFSDNCPGSTLAQNTGLASGSTFPVGTTSNSFTVTDASGNTATCGFSVTVNDTENPTITCPANITVGNDNGTCGAVVSYTVNFSDNCPGSTLAQNTGLASGSTFPVGTTSNSFTVTDASGNTATCSFTVTVNDTENPTITCPANITVGNDNGSCGAVVSYTVNFSDNCPGSTLAQNTGLASGSTFPVGTTSNSFTVTDASGNTATCGFTVTVNDTENPTITCPANITVGNDNGSCGAVVSYTVNFSDNCPGSTLAQNTGLASGSTFPVGTTSNSFTVTDASGNTATCGFTVTVNDTENPTIACPANITVGNDNGSCGAVVTYAVSFSDNCPGSTLAQNTGLASGSTFPVGTTSNSFTVTDASGNTSTCGFTVTVNDTENPTITCPANITVGNDNGSCGAIVTYTVNFSDNCPGSTLAQNSGLASGSTFPVGTTSNSFTVTDASGNTATCGFTVTVNDTENPTITCPANITVGNGNGSCGAVVSYTVNFSDNCLGSTLAQNTGLASGSTFPVGTTSNSFTVTDASGNTATCGFTVTVNDTENPTITCPANITVGNDNGSCGAVVSYTVNFSDNCPGSTLAQNTGLASGSTFPVGTTSNSFTVTDASGNTATCGFTVTVNDTENPTITCPANITVSNDNGSCGAVVSYTVNFSDNCPGSTVAQNTGLASGSTFPVGTTSNSFRVTDASGNTATCGFTVTVNDTENPTITCPANITVGNDNGSCGAVVSYTVNFSDNCPGSTLAQNTGLASGSTFPVGTTSNSFTVTDASGNTATCGFTVTVNDTENPTITCPANITVSNDNGSCGAVVTYTVNFSDNCPGSTLAQNTGLASGSTFPVGTTSNSFTVTDASGNTATCGFTVTVNDTENPTITCPANMTLSNDSGVCGAVVNYTVSFSDNCPGASLAQISGLPSGSTFPIGTTGNRFTVTDASGNTATCSFDVTVNDTENPTITCPANIIVGNDTGVCGAVVNYTVNFSDNCPGASLAQTSGLPSGSTFPVGNTTNSFTVTDAFGNTAICSFDVRVNDTERPSIICPADMTVSNDPGICGAVVTYSVSFNDNCPGFFLTQTGGLSSGSTFPVGIIRNDFTVTDGFGNSAACSFTVTVNDTENPTVNCPANIVVNTDPGQCSAVVNYTVTFNDNCPGVVLVQSSGLPSGAAFPAGTTVNQFRAIDASGNFSLCSFNVTVNDQEAPIAICQNITVSTGSAGIFTITGNNINNGSSDACGIASLNANPSSFTCANQGPNPVVLTVTDLSGNTSTCTATVTINAITQPVISASGPTTFCAGGSVILDAGVGYTSYLWSTGATTRTITVTTSGTYTVTVTNANGCSATASPVTVTANANPTPVITGSGPFSFCAGTGVTLDAGAGYASYLWSTGATTRTLFVLLPGTYNVTVTDANGCSGAATPVTVSVSQNPTPIIFSFGPTTFCQGGSVTLDAGGGYSSYLWSTGATTRTIVATTSGTYSVTVTNAAGCPGSASRTVTVNPNPSPTITPSGPTTFCAGGSVNLNAGSGYLQYSWSTGAITQSITVTTSGTYNVTVTDLNGCVGAGTPVTVTVNPRPSPVITPSGPTTFCAGGSVTLNAGSGYSSYAWSTGATTQSIVVGTSGTYTVTVTNSFGCFNAAAQTVTVNPLPTVNIAATNNGNICFGDPETLTATTGYSSYAWSTGATTNPISTTTPGTYTVTVTNSFGCTNSASKTVTAVTQCTVPTGLVANPVGSITATLNWAATPCAEEYRVQYRRLGTNPWTTININAPTTSVNIAGLLPNRTYEWRMRVTCTQGGPTNYTNIVTFTTTSLGLRMAGASGEAGVQAPLLYPNPNNGKFTLEYFADVEVQVQVCVYDMFGKRVHCEAKLAKEEGNVWEMEFANLSKGMYFLKVESVEQGAVEPQSIRFIVE